MRLPALFLALITSGDVTAFAPFAFHRSRRVFALRSTVSAVRGALEERVASHRVDTAAPGACQMSV